MHFIPDGTPFTVPDVPLRTIYINPNGGNDANDGLSTSRALRTLSEAWDRVPRGALAAGQGVRLVLLPGHLGLSDVSGPSCCCALLQPACLQRTLHYGTVSSAAMERPRIQRDKLIVAGPGEVHSQAVPRARAAMPQLSSVLLRSTKRKPPQN